MNSKSSIDELRGVGQKRAELYRKLDLYSVGDLLYFYPRQYLDMTDVRTAFETSDDVPVCLKAEILKKEPPHYIRRGLTLFKCLVSDRTSYITITLFNNKYAFDALEIGKEYLVYGKLSTMGRKRQMSSPLIVPYTPDGTMKPIYRLTAGLTSNMISTNMREALTIVDESVNDYLPAAMRQAYGLCHIGFALKNIHFPKDAEHLAIARRRLCFEELLFVQLALNRVRRQNEAASRHRMENADVETFYQTLPFSPTGAQKRAVEECLSDMQKDVPMNRLVQGDVGSGKTLVAAAVAAAVCQNGYQAAMMAPTELLAVQHYQTMTRFLEPMGLRAALLTGSMKAAEKRAVLAELADGSIDFIVGTHALLTATVHFKNLGLVITDEQHRFGVGQRATLSDKGDHPHTLVMSATPIPRTLSLIVYGDLDLSIIDEMPAGRMPIETYRIDSDKRERAYGFLHKHVQEGRQAYVVCSLIEAEEGIESDLLSVNDYAKMLQKALPDVKIGVLHGKQKAADKDAVMAAFRDKEIDILVSTTVVEVGVDVPNAVVMMIENAERFGLSQLHQLRGRVGRGRHKSYCILVCDSRSEDAAARLSVLCKTTDGFQIAEEDLKLRGAGDLIGERQHGLPSLKMQGLYTDRNLIIESRKAAQQLLRDDPKLEKPDNRFLHKKVDSMLKDIINN